MGALFYFSDVLSKALI